MNGDTVGPPMRGETAAGAPLRGAHLTTIDMSLWWLLRTELEVDLEAGFAVYGISAPGPFGDALEALGVRHVPGRRSRVPGICAGTLAALIASDATYGEPRAGDTTTVGSLLIEFANPSPHADFDDLHASRLAFRVTYGEVAFLFTGDAEAATEARMLAAHPDLHAADVYQVGHHGSATSTTPALLTAVDPAVAVYSAGAGNRHGHPHPEVVDRLAAAGAAVYGTDTHGTVGVTTEGATLTVATEHDAPPIATSSASPDTEADRPPTLPTTAAPPARST